MTFNYPPPWVLYKEIYISISTSKNLIHRGGRKDSRHWNHASSHAKPPPFSKRGRGRKNHASLLSAQHLVIQKSRGESIWCSFLCPFAWFLYGKAKSAQNFTSRSKPSTDWDITLQEANSLHRKQMQGMLFYMRLCVVHTAGYSVTNSRWCGLDTKAQKKNLLACILILSWLVHCSSPQTMRPLPPKWTWVLVWPDAVKGWCSIIIPVWSLTKKFTSLSAPFSTYAKVMRDKQMRFTHFSRMAVEQCRLHA